MLLYLVNFECLTVQLYRKVIQFRSATNMFIYYKYS